MAPDRLDKIHIRGLLLRCVIGVRDWERKVRQDVVLDVTLHADLTEACATDALSDTVDYVSVNKRLIDMVEGSEFELIERLAEEVARVCLEDPRIRGVDVRLDKPGALRYARTVGVEISRWRDADAGQ
jgi:FolB domain-containing protein